MRKTALAAAALLGVVGCTATSESSSNRPPVAVIAEPEAGAVYHGKDSIAYSGSATDPEDGAVPASRLTWWVELHHDTHTHPFLPRTTGAGGKVFVPPIGETSDNVFLRFYLEAADADGLMDTVSTDVLPVKVQFTLATSPAGLAVTLDGQPQVTPVTITGVVGMQRELGATSPQTLSGSAYRFTSWSDGGDSVHDISTPATSTTYTARFTQVPNRLPTVSLSAGGSAFTVNTTVTLTASASDADGTVSKVGFYDGATLLGEDTATPYVWNWTPTTTGSHSLTARATDNRGGVTTSAAVPVTINPSPNVPPTATLTVPSSLTVGVAATLTATAADADGTVTKVGFYDGSTLLGEDTSSPYSFSWTPSTSGSHTLSARATDNRGGVGTSTATVSVNAPPTVSITAPASGATVVVGTAVPVTATAADADGTIAHVRFLDGATLIADDTASPYSATWTPATTGTHSLTAVAIDNKGAQKTSAAVSVTVNPLGPDLQPPTLALTSPVTGTEGITGTPTVTVTTADNRGVTRVDYQLDGDDIGQATSAPWSHSIPTGKYTTGVHVIRARARDAAGNMSAWSQVRVTFGGDVSLPAGFTRTTYIQGLKGQATLMAFAPDGRLFICEQSGALRVVKNGVLLSTPFVTVSTTAEGERGLLGVAIDPQFATNRFIYVYYTSATGGKHNRISRFTASGDVAVPGSEHVLADLPNLSAATNHNGGSMLFGPDGKLYVGVGENATPSNSQSLTTPMGKMLRFNADGTIPSDNPFVSSTTGINKAIWAMGLRNPFSFTFDPSGGRMLINDVGQNTWEEIDVGRAGANYGWPTSEGATTNPAFDTPLFTYKHSDNSTLVVGKAIVGGNFYRPATVKFPANWVGNYFFGDYVDGWIDRLDPNNGNAVYAFARMGYHTSILTGNDGALYVLGDVGGSWGVFRITKP